MDGVNEIVETLEMFMETYKKHAAENIINHSKVTQSFNLLQEKNDENKFEIYLDQVLLTQLQQAESAFKIAQEIKRL